jgi:hypothetical protein
VAQPCKNVTILISNLYEGGNREAMLKHAVAFVGGGVNLIA